MRTPFPCLRNHIVRQRQPTDSWPNLFPKTANRLVNRSIQSLQRAFISKHDLCFRPERFDLLLYEVQVRAIKDFATRVSTFTIHMFPAPLSAALYVEQAKRRRKSLTQAFLVDRVAKPVNGGVGIRKDLRDEPPI